MMQKEFQTLHNLLKNLQFKILKTSSFQNSFQNFNQLFSRNYPFHLIQFIQSLHRSQIIDIQIFDFVTDLF